ncbi:ectonucleotide pyrophosphatase/phosphodiesterase family member 1 isoform X1 [Paramormyrops kingsleyae]|uniref:ectonucleotide pyrophosphatase/phosphodiesterase family member 1 isoform X1 n=1 Tax=Paramormyrops kingsleyae TaxID=1676925 RepID=UPI000CD66DCA|nr:ectonucleotide pyrophosphatase/phosphodiesterase family member 3-like [Paramormyrops kingsleyae]
MENQGNGSGCPEAEEHTVTQAATLLTQEEVTHAGDSSGRKARKRRLIFAVLLLCLLIGILAVILALKQRSSVKGYSTWINEACEDMEAVQCPKSFSKSPLILVSMDGFRAGYLEDHGKHLPAISKMRTCGTSTSFMRPAYPTKTFPNHYTIVTGLYPESHGIVDNRMYDVRRNASFSLKSEEKYNQDWYLGQPVWLTAKYNKLKAGTFFWPGSDVPINGSFPDQYRKYNREVTAHERIQTVMEWLALPPEERPDFYTLYFEEPDSSGHRHGPESKELLDALKTMDTKMDYLMSSLKERGLHKCVNIVFLSDHGMEVASCQRSVYISAFQENLEAFTVLQGPAPRIQPRRLPEDFFTFDYEGLVKNLSCRTENMRPYLKEHLPKRLHFASSVRIERGLMYMKERWQAAQRPGDLKYCKGGFHGSDNVFKNMQAVFIGYGPGFKSATTVPPFENIEVYNLLCDLLNIPPAPNNGTHGSLNHLLRAPVHTPVFPAELSPATSCVAPGRAPPDDLGCTCRTHTKAQLQDFNDKLRTYSSYLGAKRQHLPYGIPRVLQPSARHCVLYHPDYINGFSRDTFMPLWVAYTINPLNSVQPLRSNVSDCLRVDVRIPQGESQKCPSAQLDGAPSVGFLHPPNLGNEMDSLITSNMVPMYPTFRAVWTYFHNVLLVNYSNELNGLNVMSGPIFDQNFDGNYDVLGKAKPNEAPTPTHFYVLLTSCRNTTFSPGDCVGPLQTVAFILPHRPDLTEACPKGSDLHWVQEWAQFHVARVRDVELLTGLSFYHDRISVTETLQLKTFLQLF